MVGNDQFEALAERLFCRKAEQRGTGAVPANDRPGVVGADESVTDLIKNLLGQFGRRVHGCNLLGRTRWVSVRFCTALVVSAPCPASPCRCRFRGWADLRRSKCLTARAPPALGRDRPACSCR